MSEREVAREKRDQAFADYWERCDDCSACNGFTVAWDNPPHKKHKCRPQDGGCGEIFKTANLPTNGVAALEGQPQPDEPVEKGEVCENKENGNESRV